MMKKVALPAAVVGVLLLVVALCCIQHFFRDTVIGTVTEKVVKRYDDDDKYLIFVDKGDGEVETLENTDSLIEWKWDSSDMYAKIHAQKKYRFKVYGWRVKFMSWYKNIVGVEEITVDKP